MLKSTHKTQDPLPPGWTEHKAPSGHTYYYNSETKQSTYTKPTDATDVPLHIDYNATQPDYNASPFIDNQKFTPTHEFPRPHNDGRERAHFTGGRSYQDRTRRSAQEDRPKSKAVIPNCHPWVLVKTKLGRRFVHNTESRESFWKFPQDVMLAVIEMDKIEWEAKQRGEESTKRGDAEKQNEEQAKGPEMQLSPSRVQEGLPGDEDDDSYEEVEVTDSEAEDEGGQKRQRLSSSDQPKDGPVEFTESDIAYQLAQMGEDYGLDPSEYDQPYDAEAQYSENEEELVANGRGEIDQGLPLTDADAVALFKSLLDAHKINPYTTFDRVIEDGQIVHDNRYAALPTTTRRREVFSEWSRERIQQRQQQRAAREQQAKPKEPKVEYLAFLSDHVGAVGKLFWAEFKRKMRKETIMRSNAVTEKDKEKMYRDFAARIKNGSSGAAERRKELGRLLKEVSKDEWKSVRDLIYSMTDSGEDQDEAEMGLPSALVKDVRYWVVPRSDRKALIRTHIESLGD